MYDLICARTIGASHIRSNMPCQDYGMVKENEKYKVFVVSDGHGDPNCFRSDIGSKLICEVTADILPCFIDTVMENESFDLLCNLDKNLIKQLSASLIGNWLCRIEEDVLENPITQEVINDFENNHPNKKIKYANDYVNNIRTERAYGCTLIAGILSKDFLFLLHHGDGKCIIINENGDITQPVPWDNRCLGSMTTSCCDKDAIDSIRYSFINLKEKKVIACFLSSDGVEDSFASIDAMYSYFYDTALYGVENGAENLNEYLYSSLPELSAIGSADDITICGFLDIAECAKFTSEFQSFSKKIDLVSSLEKTNDKIQSILNGGLYNHLKKDYTDAQNKYKSVNFEYENLCAEKGKIEHDLSLLSDQMQQSDDSKTIDSNYLILLIQKLYKLQNEHFFSTQVKTLAEDLSLIIQKIETLEKRKNEVELKLNESKKAFEKIDKEYKGYLTLKQDLEQQIHALQSQNNR